MSIFIGDISIEGIFMGVIVIGGITIGDIVIGGIVIGDIVILDGISDFTVILLGISDVTVILGGILIGDIVILGGMLIGDIVILLGILIGDIPILTEEELLILPTSRHGNTMGGILYLFGRGEKGVINIGGISGGGGIGISKGVITSVTTGSIEAVRSVGVNVTEHLSLKIVKTGSGVEFGAYVCVPCNTFVV